MWVQKWQRQHSEFCKNQILSWKSQKLDPAASMKTHRNEIYLGIQCMLYTTPNVLSHTIG